MDKDQRIQQLEQRIADLERTIELMDRAAVLSAVTLLHQFGISGEQAEEIWRGGGTSKHTPVETIPEFNGQVSVVRLPVPPAHTVDEIKMGNTVVAGAIRFRDIWVEFDRLIPLGIRIEEVCHGGYRMTGVVPLEHTDDCTYRCSVELAVLDPK